MADIEKRATKNLEGDTKLPGPVAARILRVLARSRKELYLAEIIKNDPLIKASTMYAGYDDLVRWGWANSRPETEAERKEGQRGAPRVFLIISCGGLKALQRFDYVHLGVIPNAPLGNGEPPAPA